MTTIPHVAQAMQTVLSDVANDAARATKFVQRRSKMDGAKFVQTLVFTWLAKPKASLGELSQTAAALGVAITPQGIDERFTPEAAECVKQVLEAAVGELVAGTVAAVDLLRRFAGVCIEDSTIIKLPPALATVYRGCGGSKDFGQAAAKVSVRLNLTDGSLTGPCLDSGRVHDRASRVHQAPVPPGMLCMEDLGYWDLNTLQARTEQGVFWLSRLHSQAVVFDAHGTRWETVDLLHAQTTSVIDLPVRLGVKHQLAARLIAIRVPQEVADRRRQRLREEAHRRQQPLTARLLALAEWTILVTNVPPERLSSREALVLMTARWQIELLFKLWKSQGQIDEWATQNPHRILCELHAKLLAMLIQHWLLLLGCWERANRSWVKAAQTIQKQALHLASHIQQIIPLIEALTVIVRSLASSGCRLNSRKRDPNTYQLLLALSEEALT
jgi:hypothetical protein